MGYVWKYRGMALAAIALLILLILLNLISPMITKAVIDDVIREGNHDLLPNLLFAILAISLCKGVVIYFNPIILRKCLKTVFSICETSYIDICSTNLLVILIITGLGN